MDVPAHDQRDFELSQNTKNLSVRQIATSKDGDIDLTSQSIPLQRRRYNN